MDCELLLFRDTLDSEGPRLLFSWKCLFSWKITYFRGKLENRNDIRKRDFHENAVFHDFGLRNHWKTIGNSTFSAWCARGAEIVNKIMQLLCANMDVSYFLHFQVWNHEIHLFHQNHTFKTYALRNGFQPQSHMLKFPHAFYAKSWFLPPKHKKIDFWWKLQLFTKNLCLGGPGPETVVKPVSF